jgi:excisionase family DNA binding protein
MYLSVQRAARRLGVSPYTIRRWTESGLLPCIRTAGGHRRIKQEDVDELALLTAGGDRVAARLAREREMETLVEASVALTSRLDLTSLLVEIARRLSAILDCHFCAVSDYDEETTMVRVLADFDRQGQRVTDWKPYSLRQFPFTRRLMEDQEPGVVTLSDPRADPAETAVMRHYGDRTMLVVPLVYRGRSVGFIEVYDHLRERRFTRQELRLACALAGLATTALHNAKVFAELSRCHTDAKWLQAALDGVTDGLPALAAAGSAVDVLHEAALLACRTLNGLNAVASWGEATASAGDGSAGGEVTRVVGSATAGSHALEVSVALHRGGDDEARVLRLIAASAAQAIVRA